MGKKVDLNEHRTSNDNGRVRHHPNNRANAAASIPQETANPQKEPSALEKKGDELAKEAAKKYMETKVPKFVAESEAMDKMLDKAIAKYKIKIKRKRILALVIILLPFLLFLLALMWFVTLFFSDDLDKGGGSGMATAGYYTSQCPEITVIFTDKTKGYEPTRTETYPIEEYVAGVIAGEVGFFGNLEVDKAFAIAARTFVLTHETDCTIESSDRRQVFRELTEHANDKLAIQAAEETAGQVILLDGKLKSTQYDAFACIAKDSTYYTISQANQKVPIEWVESRLNPEKTPSWFICNGKENLKNHHGNGMSQYGSLYLASEKGYTYDEILDFYLGDLGVSISRGGGFMTSIANLEIKNTTQGATLLNVKLEDYLSQNGSSMEDINTFVKESVDDNGWGTREGVVTAAVSLVNYLYDNFKVRIPYYWGGNYQYVGVSSQFGGKTTPVTSKYGTTYNFVGLDCSGFVSWAIRNGGYNMDRKTTVGFHSAFSGDSCKINDSSCIGQPGDLINSKDCHVQMIVAVDEESNTYYVAESTGGDLGVITRPVGMHSSNCGEKETRILHMDSFYNNEQNVDQNH